MKFTKMQGTGNDFIIIEDMDEKFKNKESELALKLCDRHFGIGADGVLFIRDSDAADIQMVIFNGDGSHADMCGNGLRCFAKYVWEKSLVAEDAVIKIETGDGVKEAVLEIVNNEVESVTVNMGSPSFIPEKIPADSSEEIINIKIHANHKDYNITSMLLGVPHTVIFGKLDSFNIEEGRDIERLELFPKRTNVNFCEVIDKDHIKIKTWERGAGPTLACGTGSCASVIAANMMGLTEDQVNVEVPGGNLVVQITESGVLMTGPAVVIFEGEIKI